MGSVRVHIHSLGCPKNDADSSALERRLRAMGVATSARASGASHILINTCGFIEDAKAESVNAILEATASYPDTPVLVMGCLVQRYRHELEEGIPEVAGWFGLGEVEELVARIASDSGSETAGLESGRPSGRSYAYVKISDGCDHRCSFCAIPSIKGPYAALPLRAVVSQAEAAIEEGARELVLVGQDTAIWSDGDLDLTGLLDRLAAYDEVERLRLLYLQPEHIDDALLEYVASAGKVCDYLDVPFQHASHSVLRGMRRWGDGGEYLSLLSKARALMPHVSLRSTFIVGFPGETAEDFEVLMDFVQDAGLHHAGAFLYSAEEGTPAADMRKRVPLEVGRERLGRLSDALLSRSEVALGEVIGRRVQVLVDALGRAGPEGAAAVGRTAGQAPEVDGVTYLTGDSSRRLCRGDLTWAVVTDVLGVDLIARLDEKSVHET